MTRRKPIRKPSRPARGFTMYTASAPFTRSWDCSTTPPRTTERPRPRFATAIKVFQELKEGKVEALLWTLLADLHLTIDSHVSAGEAVARARELAKTSKFSMAAALADFLDATSKWRRGERIDMRAAFAAVLTEREAHGLVLSDEAKRFMGDLI